MPLNSEVRVITGRWVYIAPGDRSIITLDEEVKRICNLSLLTNNRENREAVYDNLNYALFMEVSNTSKVAFYRKQLDECIDRGIISSQYKLDYIIEQDKYTNSFKLTAIN